MRIKCLLILPLLVASLQAADKSIYVSLCAEPIGNPGIILPVEPPELPTIYVGDNVEIIVDTCDIIDINNVVIGFNGEARQADPTGIPGHYSSTFSIQNSGDFNLIVSITDDYGNVTNLQRILVLISPDSPPTATITSPTNGGDSPYSLGDIIAIDISASDSDGNVTQVEVFNGANSIGFANLVGVDTYRFDYQASSPGQLNLQVRAADDLGNIGFSDLVPITVLPQHPSETLDSDDDGILDTYETNTGIYVSQSDTGTDPYNSDTDNDGLNDGIEIKYSIPRWAYEDIDSDGWLDLNEDVDGDGNLDVDEDIDGDGNLDVDEDIDGDGNLGIYEYLEYYVEIPLSPEEAITYGDDTILNIEEYAHNGSWAEFLQYVAGLSYYTGFWHDDVDNDGNLDVDEDIDGDGKLDYDEDVDVDGNLDVNEDIDGDGNLDVDEDTDGDGLLGRALISSNTDPNVADSDGDGLSDGDEAYLYNTDFNLADSDYDGLIDGDEIYLHNTNPTSDDTDNDWLRDGDEVSIYGTNPNSSDSDNDGMTDREEIFNTQSTDPNNPDSDGDGLDDSQEVTFNTDPNLADTSGDGLKDGVVVSAGFDPTVDYSNLVNASRQGMTDLRAGSTILDVSNNQATIQIQMEESSDLQSWEDTGDPATMTIPADTDTKFYRFKMTE